VKKNIKISKLDAAKRQIECAITLYFNESDPVSTHTLASAAYNILRALNKGQVWMVKDRISDHIVKGKEKEAMDVLNRYENFFKHADRDPDDVLNFNPEATETTLWECCTVYRQHTGESPEKMVAFNIWFKLNHHDFFIYTEEERQQAQRANQAINSMSKREYFGLMIMSLNRIDA
jgi:hypothetical protein